MSESPVLTIGMPIYNGASLMRRAIDSVLMQDFRDLELIISDNASTDETAAIAAEYAAADSRVRHVRRAEGIPPLQNFRGVLWEARGEMFSWIAHDDFYHRPDHVRRLVEKIREGNTFAFPGVHMVHLYDDGTIVREETDTLAGFGRIRTRRQLVREAIRHPSVQIYGMFRTGTLREYFRLLLEDRDRICFFEGRFIQSLLINEPWAFVPEATLNVGQSAANYTRRLNPRPLLRDYLRYSVRLLSMYRHSPRFTRLERLNIYADLVREHAPYAARLFASVMKQSLRAGKS